MTVVLVHGNPETPAVWEPLLDALGPLGVAREQVVRLAPPGCGAPLPDDFPATVEAYRAATGPSTSSGTTGAGTTS